MALKLRRGLSTDRVSITPAEGELLYTTDTKLVYVGDGSTAGGNVISSGGGGGGLSAVVDDTSPQLGGNLEVNGFDIVSTSGQDININPDTGGDVVLHGNLYIDSIGNITKSGQLNLSPTGLTTIGNNTTPTDGGLYITRNTYSASSIAGFTFAQHHGTADAVNFTFFRTRGTGLVPSAVQNGDDIIDMAFIGYGASASVPVAGLSVTVDGVPSATQVPGKFTFSTNNGTSAGVRAELSAAGIWKVNSIQNYSGTTLSVTAPTINVSGDITLIGQSDIKFADSDSSNWVSFQAPATIASNVVWTLPSADGTSGQALTTNGSGTLSWSTISGGAGSSRTTISVPTGVIADGATANLTLTGYKGYILYKIETTAAAWVRIYTDVPSRTGDSSRVEGADPLPGSGVIAEVITTGAQSILMSPGVIGFNGESSPSSNIYLAVTNKSGGSATITVTLTVLQIEV